MGRSSKVPQVIVAPVSSKKQLLDKKAVCQFMAGISIDTLDKLRNEPGSRFPQPLQIFGGTPTWSVEQIERYIARNEKDVEKLSA